MLPVLLASVSGVLVSGLMSGLPGFHVYNLLAIGVVLGGGHAFPIEWVLPFTIGLVVGFSVFSAIPSVLLAAPDESAFFTVLPGQRMLMDGRGGEAVLCMGAGSLIALAALCGSAAALPTVVPVAHAVLSRHAYWIVWCVIAFMLLSEWPKANTYWVGPAARLAGAWRQLAAGLLTFVLSGVLGLVLMHASPIAPQAAFQNLMPAFVGLFTLPWLLMNLLTRVQAPPQNETGRPGLDARSVGVGGAAGVLGGAFAAFVPGVTGGVGGMLAGHALAIRDSRAFLVSQGASRSVYMSGALLLFFLPDGALTRGGAAAMLPVLHGAAGTLGYASAAAALAFSAAAACLLLRPITRGAVTVLERVGCRPLSWTALAGAVTLVLGLTGVAGLIVAAVATAIGLVPVLHGSRRMNALGVILLPLALNLSGVGPDVARFLGLASAGR
jgi:putative membrane protein